MHELNTFLNRSKTSLSPFDPLLIDFCQALSNNLFAHSNIKQYPDITALAFWLRRAHIEELHEIFRNLHNPQQLLVPRGLVFHIAPGNVETMFVYSWILSLLIGNSNVVRLPSRESPGLSLLFQTLNLLLEKPEFAPIQQTTFLLSYGHEQEITAAISSKADVRVIWGGDETIQAIRKIPLKASAHEIVFADRYAFAAIDTASYLAASEEERQTLVHAFYTDAYWYDQMTCASPRTLFWVGNKEQADSDFFRRLQKHLEDKRYRLPLALALQKETYLYSQALVLEIKAVRRHSNELTVVDLATFDPNCRQHIGAGLLYSIEVSHLNDLANVVNDKDQTLVHYGFSPETLQNFTKALNGKGLDRIVPIGQALNFDYLWDGYNLLQEFSRAINIK